ncbi:conserved Plasmodium protein, unknown function [Plasmodium berghei]|uniref:Uncharacterized protein n=2 Tax=Plasmodium berghei TaxID=5821 RepID=A0A509ASV6_PLABA|nr:conserved Plasmodium protein, unknown function [Plasmodium berghei ANKA]CXJ27087.1 conserved Plasmodium protein, unknown function [Plasmodium berghei]SCM26973.1 conserved Plasmodium protein, unknown function [Plasmodium berghei]SCN28730.1 conserved Plasmodium protein, unknown function [Plasmodium berghei]SCO62986.1 conserved Plasmodium protein, unknown function [Plasmodium berghei]SCO64477.1 conserved Plasmodium protein, unknown function [Plasmodium berghei]|eukprot:XP_034424376.1 conserved Plasmodium protein, unknown function [Plasmodium berghei ANKA]
MEKQLEKGISAIKKIAKKYESVLKKINNGNVVKTINKRKRIRNSINTINNIPNNFENINTNKEDKIKKLSNYLINQENELDSQENMYIFNKYNEASNKILYNPLNDNSLYIIQKTRRLGTSNDYNNDKTNDYMVNGSYIDSIKLLELKIKHEIQQNNDFLFYQKQTKLNGKSNAQPKGTWKEINEKKIYNLNKRLKHQTLSKSKKNSKILLNYKKNVKLRTEREVKLKCNNNNSCEKEYSDFSKDQLYKNNVLNKNMEIKLCENDNKITKEMDIDGNDNITKQINPKKNNDTFEENKKNTQKTNNIYNITKKGVNDVFKSSDGITLKYKNNLVFGLTKFENINDATQNEINQKSETEIYTYNNGLDTINDNIGYNKTDKNNEMYINEYFKECINNINNKTPLGKNNIDNDNQKDLKTYDIQDDKSSRKKMTTEFNMFLSENTPLKDENSFDLFFNEPLATPSIFHA